MRRATLLGASATLALAGCTTAPKPVPAPAAPSPPAPITTLVPPAPGQTDWRDLPLTEGAWSYAREGALSAASYGLAGAPVFVLRCDPTQHVLTLTRSSAAGNAMTIQTSYSSRTIPATSGPSGALLSTLNAHDPTLDQLAFSRGRFSIASAGLPTLNLPAWAEPARVIEDCR